MPTIKKIGKDGLKLAKGTASLTAISAIIAGEVAYKTGKVAYKTGKAAYKQGKRIYEYHKKKKNGEIEEAEITEPQAEEPTQEEAEQLAQEEAEQLAQEEAEQRRKSEEERQRNLQHYKSISTEAEKLWGEFQNDLNDSYMRTSHWLRVRKEVESRVQSWQLPVDQSLFDEVEQHKLLNKLHRISIGDSRTLGAFRDKYIRECRSKYDNFFSNVEANPLTNDQRTACIVDEDNNLVLAGAGTGKTSTMIGRAGFLIKSGQSDGSDILMLAFNSKAAEELRKRASDRSVDYGNITISTFHKLGKDIVAEVEGQAPSVTVLANDKKRFDKWVNDQIENLFQKKNGYKGKAIEYFDKYMYPEKNPFDFETEGEYIEYVRSNDIQTLQGEKVKGHGERLIANYLFKMGIKYEYEPYYKHKINSIDYKRYQPDFYLPEYEIYIEHFGIDERGNTAKYINPEKYHTSMEWKQETHEQYGTILVETYFYEHKKGVLIKELEKKLQRVANDNGKELKFDPISDDGMLDILREKGRITGLAILIRELLEHYKANNERHSRLEQRIRNSGYKEQMMAARDLLDPIMTGYQEELDRKEEIDFNDMINKAIRYLKEGNYAPNWRYIMVDEFQDISEQRYLLIKLLKGGINDCSLFCVGDDWQSINRFAGSDIAFITDFKNKFGNTKKTVLGKTFRFNNSIANVSSEFVMKNPAQIKKKLTTSSKVDTPAVSLLMQSKDDGDSLIDPLQKILTKITEVDSKASVLLLGRYNRGLGPREQIKVSKEAKKLCPNMRIDIRTVHKSKGAEADYVILLGLESGKNGFPSEKLTNPLLNILLPKEDNFLFAEERRLFYVALTRARKKVYLVTDISMPSSFVTELIDGDYKITVDEFKVSPSQKAYQKTHCVRCKSGVLKQRSRDDGSVFYGCSNYPLCKHTEKGCPDCNGPMTRVKRRANGFKYINKKRVKVTGEAFYKKCINPECGCRELIPTCPECGAVLRKRDGKSFWGCSNYKSNEPISCGYMELDENVNPPAG